MNYLVQHKTALLYLAVGQVGWFACVLGAARSMPWVGVAIVAGVLVWHVVRVARPLAELKLVTTVALLGAVWETLMRATGLMAYPHEAAGTHHAPYWIIALWALFAAQINVSYGWLKSRLWAAAVLGAIAGPASFRAGAALHAVQIDDVWRTMPVLAAGWACLLPIMVLLSRHWNGVEPPPAERVGAAAGRPAR